MNTDGQGEHPLLPALQPADQTAKVLSKNIDVFCLREKVIAGKVVTGNSDALGKPGDFVFPEAITPKQFFGP